MNAKEKKEGIKKGVNPLFKSLPDRNTYRSFPPTAIIAHRNPMWLEAES